jgi:hypothetical protein
MYIHIHGTVKGLFQSCACLPARSLRHPVSKYMYICNHTSTRTQARTVTVHPCGPRTKAVAMGAWLHLTPWKWRSRIGPRGNHGEH